MHLFHMYGARRHYMVEPVLKEDGTPFKVAILIPTINNADELAIVLDRLTEHTGPANIKVKMDGKEIDLSKTKTTTKAEKREYEIIKDSDQRKGVLSTESYMCPKCDCTEVYFYLEQTRSSDEPETRMLTCKDCGHGWREY